MYKKKVRIDTVPIWLKTFYYPISFLIAGAFYLFWKLIIKSCKIEIKGANILKKYPSHIIAVWHRMGTYYWMTRLNGKGYIELAHPIWYMIFPVLVMRWSGAKVILGSTGHNGRVGANKIVQKLNKGFSTVITVDGPRGPIFEVKKGALHMSLQSQKPIIPLVITGSNSYIFSSSWDKKRIPMPFSTITLNYKKPIYVTDDNFSESIITLKKELG
ncbi:MAG: DUF374 domain-containing protein [Candidatus Marinimicrobia bacterium]|jgi:hypothetical protein|nr:DUF374 domain-containing protein [Candidatus Neomarinimicrobiota bacterium]MBT3501337.1 DUF374 domain-containing protein [Candidatus Neomarinimicrobiota bacterium]MBT3838537.1 DUF374 domain-containing protein [Candidatus Neomarinimicrobiota bacterium]MBT3999919.1 DUF374 domain-containing protein [Candidatus Neomarinimicrobiota bacterium]MBT4282568.1 DUF374 domain-containing protein [Candidatus Neomarinimicrobiota bacterium]